MSTTIKELAKATGLSHSTVSAYINGEKVRPYNQIKIENAIAKMGYIPNDYARSLKMRSSKMIGVLVPNIDIKVTSRILTEMQNKLRIKGYGTIICDSRSDKNLEQEMITFLLSKMVDGLIIQPVTEAPEALDVVREKGKPVVAFNTDILRKDISHLLPESGNLYRKAFRSMVEKGRKHIAFIYAGSTVMWAKERLNAYREVLSEAGIYDERYIDIGEISVKGGYDCMKKMLARYPATDGVFVANYEMSMGAWLALKHEGKKIPEEISFVGVDFGDDGDIFDERPASVDTPVRDISDKLADMIVDAIENGSVKDVTAQYVLVEGKSI